MRKNNSKKSLRLTKYFLIPKNGSFMMSMDKTDYAKAALILRMPQASLNSSLDHSGLALEVLAETNEVVLFVVKTLCILSI